MKLLVHWLLASLAFVVTSQVVPGFIVESFPAALLAALVVGLLNIFIWPLFALLTLPLTILTLGLFLFVLNALILKLGAWITPGFEVHGFWPAVFGSILVSLIGLIVRMVFGTPERKQIEP
jgi:putative membrane protein